MVARAYYIVPLLLYSKGLGDTVNIIHVCNGRGVINFNKHLGWRYKLIITSHICDVVSLPPRATYTLYICIKPGHLLFKM